MKKILVRAGFVLAVVATTAGVSVQVGSVSGVVATPNNKQWCC